MESLHWDPLREVTWKCPPFLFKQRGGSSPNVVLSSHSRMTAERFQKRANSWPPLQSIHQWMCQNLSGISTRLHGPLSLFFFFIFLHFLFLAAAFCFLLSFSIGSSSIVLFVGFICVYLTCVFSCVVCCVNRLSNFFRRERCHIYIKQMNEPSLCCERCTSPARCMTQFAYYGIYWQPYMPLAPPKKGAPPPAPA